MPENTGNTWNNCCVCLCRSPNLMKLTCCKTENAETWISKLRQCVAEIDWFDGYLLCMACSNQLDFVYNFRQLCFQSHETRKKSTSIEETKFECFSDDSNERKSFKEEHNVSMQRSSESNSLRTENYSCNDCKNCTSNFTNKQELEEHCKNAHAEEHDQSDDDNFVDNDDDDSSATDAATDTDVSDSDSEDYNGKSKRAVKKKAVPRAKKAKQTVKAKETSETQAFKTQYLDLKCIRCDEVFESVSKLVKHSVSDHDMEKKEVKPYACPKCPWRFRIPYSLRDHIKYHDNIRNEVCTYCGKGFVTKAALTTHEKQHLNLREYQCPHCPKSFNTHKDIRTHKYVVHTDPSRWKHVCPVCSKRFPVKSNFDAHVRRHNNEKPYGCHLCDAKFCVPSSLRIHIQSHSNVRDHKCSECGNEYKNIKYLQQHMNKKHNIGNVKIPEKVKKYLCSMCPKKFDAKNKLSRHLCTHTGERPFPCTLCDKRFTDKSYVTQHMKTVHNFIPDTDR